VVAPILTIGFLLSVYSTSGCQFVNVDLGFTPKPNAAWNSTTEHLGFFYHYQPKVRQEESDAFLDPDVLDSVHSNCYLYSEAMQDEFIDNDRTWKVARIMALIAGGGSGLSAVLAWSFVGGCYCPVNFLWPVILLPIVMISFIAEGSKFLLFDMSICRNEIFEIETDDGGAEFEGVDSCTLGGTAKFAIASACLLLVGMLLVCFHVPNERELDPEFGITAASTASSYNDGPTSQKKSTKSFVSSSPSKRRMVSATFANSPASFDESSRQDVEGSIEEYHDEDGHVESGSSYMKRKPPSPTTLPAIPRPRHPYDQEALRNIEDDEDDEDLDTTVKSVGSSTLASSKVESVSDEIRISESRLSTLANVEEKAAESANSPTASSMLDSLVQDLNESYHQPSVASSTRSTSPTSSRHSPYLS